ncbi:uncharacterized protein LOC119604837 [Lucilia sericata]|uniref:uncharacterized protein LOC119604837 n=1 Tax=Lucilia sericata TaxID=13632 RepID=UPI0018A814D1|nr:uncharacterized protein LOC119604837 [Lucilia sericata]
MKFEELKVEQLKRELSKMELPTAGNKAELQKRLIDEFKRRDIDIGTYEFEYKEETEICTRSTTSNMDLNTMFAAMMEKFAEVQETSKADNEKLLTDNEKLRAEVKAEVKETFKHLAEMEAKFQESSRATEEKILEVSEVINSRVDGIDKKVSDLKTKMNNLQYQEGAVRIIPETSSRIKAPSFDGTTPFNVFKFQFETVAIRNMWNNEEKAIELILALKGGASSAEDFALEIELLIQLTYPGEHHPFLDIFKIEAFVNGIRDPEIKHAVCATPKPSFAETVSFALAQETAKIISKPQIFKVRNVEVVAENERNIVTEIKEAVLEALNEKQNKAKIKCYNCGKTGHIQRNCKAQRKRTRSVSPPRNNRQVNHHSSQESPLKRASTEGQELAPTSDGPTISISVMQQKNSNLTAGGYINGRKHIFTIDTGASQSIIRPDLVKKTIEPLCGVRLRTATGEPATVYGKVNAKVNIANISVDHLFIVADIVDEVIIGADFMIMHGIKLHLGPNVMIWRNVEIPLDVGYQSKAEVKESVIDVRLTHIDSTEDWSEAQRDDPLLAKIISAKEEGKRPARNEISAESPLMKSYWALWNSLQVLNGCLYRIWESADGKTVTNLIVVPASKINEVLKEFHDGPSGGHLGGKADWISNCPQCIAAKGPVRKSRGRLQQYNSGAPFERIAMDVAGPFPVSDAGNRYVLVVMDYFSKWPEVYAIPNQEAKTVVGVFVNNWICRYGVPLELHSDQGRNFEYAVFKEMCDLYGIRKTRTTPLHPQSDGMVERFNRTLEEYLRKVVSAHQKDWDEHIPKFLLAYRTAVHDSTSRTPAKIIFGTELKLPGDLEFGIKPSSKSKDDENFSQEQDDLNELHEFVRRRIKMTSDKMKARYDRAVNSEGFTEGQLVLLYSPQRKKGLSPKLQTHWEGPYVVIKKLNDVVYRIQKYKSPRSKMKVVHLERLAAYGKGESVPIRDEQA